MRIYKFNLLVYENDDETQEFLDKNNLTGIEENQETILKALDSCMIEYELKLVEYTNYD